MNHSKKAIFDFSSSKNSPDGDMISNSDENYQSAQSDQIEEVGHESILSEQKESPHLERLELVQEYLDIKKNQLVTLKKFQSTLITGIERSFHNAKFNLPTSTRNMKFQDFLKTGEKIEINFEEETDLFRLIEASKQLYTTKEMTEIQTQTSKQKQTVSCEVQAEISDPQMQIIAS